MSIKTRTLLLGTLSLLLPQATVLSPGKSLPSGTTFLHFAVVGDSNSAFDEYQWFHTWWQYIDELQPSWSFTFHGWPGATATLDGVAQVQAALLSEPDFILASLGTNDVGNFSVAEIQAVYDQMEAVAWPTPIVFIGPIDFAPWDLLPDASPFNAKIAELQRNIPMTGVIPEEGYLLPLDGIHVDGQGSFWWAQHVRKTLLNLIPY